MSGAAASGRPDLSAVLVAWNSTDHLGAALAALRGSASHAGARLEVLVIDNASGDGSAALARAAGADRVLENPLNAGFAVAAAQGLSLAGAPWVVLLNPDVTVDEGFVAAILAAVRAAPPEVATIVPELRFRRDGSRINSRGIAVDASGIPAEIGSGMAVADAPLPAEPFGGSGAACALRVEAVRAVGGLEPAYFAYLEDVDLAWRLRRAGYRTQLAGDARGSHAGSSSTGEGSPLKLYLVARNRRLLFRLHGPHGLGPRLARTLAETGHCAVATLASRRLEPALGRLASLRLSRYAGFLRRSAPNRPAQPAELALTPRPPLRAALRRKRAAGELMVEASPTAVPGATSAR